MDATSQAKVMAFGFRIIRREDSPSIRIKEKVIGQKQGWRTIRKFASKAQRDKEFELLLRDQMTISD